MYHLHLSNSSSCKAPQHVMLLIELNCTGKAFVIFSLCAQGEGEIIPPSKSTNSLWINQFGCLECRFLSPSKPTHLQFLLLFELMEFRAGEFLQKTAKVFLLKARERAQAPLHYGAQVHSRESKGIRQLSASLRIRVLRMRDSDHSDIISCYSALLLPKKRYSHQHCLLGMVFDLY